MKQRTDNSKLNTLMPLVLFWLAGMVGIGYLALNAAGFDMAGWNVMALDLWLTGMAWKFAAGRAANCVDSKADKKVLEMNFGSYDLGLSSLLRPAPACAVAYC